MDETSKGSYIYIAHKKGDELASEIMARVSSYNNMITQDNLIDSARICVGHYYNRYRDRDNSSGGNSAYNFKLDVRALENYYQVTNNRMAPFVNKIMQLTTAQAPDYNCKPTVETPDILQKSKKLKKVLNHLVIKHKLYDKCKSVQLRALIATEGVIHVDWDKRIGKKRMARKDGSTVKAGDLTFSVHDFTHLARDTGLKSFDEAAWLILRTRRKKVDLIQMYPDRKSDIEASGFVNTSEEVEVFNQATAEEYSNDYCEVYYFYHEKEPAVPEGKEAVVLASGGILLEEGKMKTEEIPIIRTAIMENQDTPFGYTPIFDLCTGQDWTNLNASTIASNQITFGAQNIIVEGNSDISRESFFQGLNVIRVQGGGIDKVKPLNLTNTPAEIFRTNEMLQEEMRQKAGVDTLTAFNASASASGQAISNRHLLEQKNVASYSAAYRHTVESLAYVMLDVLRANTVKGQKRDIQMGSKKMSFVPSEFTDMDTIEIEKVNPILNSTTFIQDQASVMLEKGLIKREEYIEVLQTGSLDSITNTVDRTVDLIRDENEALMHGDMPIIAAIDNHPVHIKEHIKVALNNTVRDTPELLANVMAHIMEHMDLYEASSLNTKELYGMLITEVAHVLGMQTLAPPTPEELTVPPGGPPIPGIAEGGALPAAESQLSEADPALNQDPETAASEDDAEAAQQRQLNPEQQ